MRKSGLVALVVAVFVSFGCPSPVPVVFSCAVAAGGAEATSPTVSFDEPSIAATRTHVGGACPDSASDNVAAFGPVNGVAFTGGFFFDTSWLTCVTVDPTTYSGGVMRIHPDPFTLTFSTSPLPKQVRVTLGEDVHFPGATYTLLATAGAETFTLTATVPSTDSFGSPVAVAGRINVTCTKPLNSLKFTYLGASFLLMMDSLYLGF